MAKILLIDDDESFRKMLRLTLASMGHDVIEASHGGEALRILATSVPDLVITDLIMPEKEGLETIMDIQSRYPGQKVIAMSGGGRINSKELLKMAGQLCDIPTIAKPFSTDQMATLINATMRGEPEKKSSKP
jgi:DNA-binding NtrC family response regulator